MNAFLKKEIRLLLPNFLFAAVLALAGMFYSDHVNGVFSGLIYFSSCVFFPALVVMLALSSFGGEVSAGTLANLLAQPVSRQKIWETKTAMLALALLGLAVLWSGAFLIGFVRQGTDYHNQEWLDLFSIVIPFGLVIFSGGLWTVLLLRQVAAAFWFTLIVPGAILTMLAALFSDHDGNFFQGVCVTVMGLYSLAGFFFARRLFFRAQDVQWSGGTIVMPEMRGLARFKTTGELREWRPRAALWRKEFMLHQSQFVMAFVLLLLHLGVLVTRQFVDARNSPEAHFVLSIFWGLWLAMPLLVGCAAVAEERKLVTLEGQLCLPVKRRTQFFIKLTVAFGLSVLFGAVVPLVLEAGRILPDWHFEIGTLQPGWEETMSPLQLKLFSALGIFSGMLPLLSFVFLTLLICFVSFYVSTLARNTLQTLAPAVLGIMAAMMIVAGSFEPWNYVWEWLWSGPVGFVIGLPVLALAVLVLMFKNFQNLRPDWRVAVRNGVVFIAALMLGILVSSAVYHRCWEKFTAFEPAHGAARLTLASPASLNVQRNEWIARLPDGKVWQSQWERNPVNRNPISRLLGNFRTSIVPGKFIGGSNWRDVQRSSLDMVGLKNDGTLWVSEKPFIAKKLADGRWDIHSEGYDHLVQFGTDTNWTSFVPEFNYTLLTKSDGTLWQWGDMKFDSRSNNWPGLQTYSPQRVGTESDWAKISREPYQTVFYKTDGSAWATGEWDTNLLTTMELMPGWMLHRVPPLRHGEYRSQTMISHGHQFMAGIANDGTFRIFADQHVNFDARSRYGYYVWSPTNLPIGTGSNWLAVAGGWQKVVTLKNDGTLWLWNFSHNGRPWQHDENTFAPEVQHTVPVQLGKKSDWIAISGNDEGAVSLAADGSLWNWPLISAENIYAFDNGNSSQNIHPVLDISRKPQLLGNVFSKAE